MFALQNFKLKPQAEFSVMSAVLTFPLSQVSCSLVEVSAYRSTFLLLSLLMRIETGHNLVDGSILDGTGWKYNHRLVSSLIHIMVPLSVPLAFDACRLREQAG